MTDETGLVIEREALLDRCRVRGLRRRLGRRRAFGRERFAPVAFRVTVATFNARALRVIEALGFSPVEDFLASTDARAYRILVRPESA